MDNFIYFAFGCLLVLVTPTYMSSDISERIDEYRFTIASVKTNGDLTQAKSWCTSNNLSTFVAIRNASAQKSLTEFLTKENASDESFFINVQLFKSQNTWYFVNGQKFEGNVDDQGDKDTYYKFYAYLRQKDRTTFNFTASDPKQTKNFICQYSQRYWLDWPVNGVNINFHSINGTYYIKYENETLTWFEARNRCKFNAGDLVTNISGFNATWLNDSLSYWVGVRWYNWLWKSPADGEETVYTHWSKGKPKTISNECVCVERSSSWNWSDCDCNTPRSFVCVKFISVPPKTLTTTTVGCTSSNQTEACFISTAGYSKEERASAKIDVPIGVGVGVGGSVLIILVAVVVIATKKCRSKQGTTERPNKTKDEERPKEKPKKPKDSEVVQQSNNFAEYADIMPLAQPIVREATRSPVFYSNPEFVETTPS